jgi:hypothetical protein
LTTEFLRDFIITDLLVKLSKDADAVDDRKELLGASQRDTAINNHTLAMDAPTWA